MQLIVEGCQQIGVSSLGVVADVERLERFALRIEEAVFDSAASPDEAFTANHYGAIAVGIAVVESEVTDCLEVLPAGRRAGRHTGLELLGSYYLVVLFLVGVADEPETFTGEEDGVEGRLELGLDTVPGGSVVVHLVGVSATDFLADLSEAEVVSPIYAIDVEAKDVGRVDA